MQGCYKISYLLTGYLSSHTTSEAAAGVQDDVVMYLEDTATSDELAMLGIDNQNLVDVVSR